MVNELDNMHKLDAIEKWQDDPNNHDLTCGNDSKHQSLVGRINEDESDVFLACVDCDYEQEWVPEIVYSQYRAEVLGENIVPLYRTPQGMYTDLKATDKIYSKIHRKILRPTDHGILKSMIEECSGEDAIIIGEERFNKENVAEWEVKHPERVAFLEYDEYECGLPCTPDGCEGHTNKHASGITVHGVTLWVEGSQEGDYPSKNQEYNDRVEKVLEDIADRFNQNGE